MLLAIVVIISIFIIIKTLNRSQRKNNISLIRKKIKKKKLSSNIRFKEGKKYDIESLTNIVTYTKSREELKKSLDYFIKNLPIPKKSGVSAPKESKQYLNFVFNYFKNENLDKRFIDIDFNSILKANPSYKVELKALEEKALELRRK